ncbi:MAG: ACP phosphodiesterase [Prevotella sp.]|jgi:acyl carrier protein phosphodiesterase|nr:ACP phosphodiesterase [Prevotella sp.]
MNFLAHAYLSFGNPDILVGNMIADQVKGRQIETYPEAIQHGIHIHRKIDAFTDSHPVTLETMSIFRASAGKYAGAFLDVSYDHFLAIDNQNEPEEGWEPFAQKCYSQIELYAELLPSKFCTMFMYMKKEDWLYNYRYNWLIEKSFERLKNRANYLDDNAPVFSDFENHYREIQESYNTFFPELKAYIKDIIQNKEP